MRISDWSSDVCSSDLTLASERPEPAVRRVDRDLDHHARTQPTVALLDRDAHLDTLRHLGEGAGFVQPRQQRELAVGGMADPVDPALEDLARIGVDMHRRARSGEHTFEIQLLIRNLYDGLCLKKKK